MFVLLYKDSDQCPVCDFRFFTQLSGMLFVYNKAPETPAYEKILYSDYLHFYYCRQLR
jgi:hypothetical protein